MVETSGQKTPHKVLRSDTDDFTDTEFRRSFKYYTRRVICKGKLSHFLRERGIFSGGGSV
jgi:hypothetical protein